MESGDSISARAASTNYLIKIKHDYKADKDIVQMKLCRDPKSEVLDLYEFKMTLFNNGDLEEFLLFVRNFEMTI